jgi:tetratricopeptide (TPR) repeat protein
MPAAPPRSADHNFVLAEKFYREQAFSPAEKLYSQVDPTSADYPLAQLRLGTIYYLTGRPTQAEKCFSIYLRFQKTPEAYCLLAGALFNQQKFPLAVSAAQHALELDPKFAKAYTVLGMIHTAGKNFTSAEADYRQALKLNDHDSDTWFMLGRTLFFRDDFTEAAKAFEHALAINPQSVRSYENLARTKDVMGDVKGAEQCYQEGLRAGRDKTLFDPHIYVQYGEFLLKLGRPEDGQRVVEEGLRTAPSDAELHYELSKIDFRMNRLPAAAQEGEMALRLDGPDYKVDFLLAQIYTAMGNTEEASKHASRAAQSAPNSNP